MSTRLTLVLMTLWLVGMETCFLSVMSRPPHPQLQVKVTVSRDCCTSTCLHNADGNKNNLLALKRLFSRRVTAAGRGGRCAEATCSRGGCRTQHLDQNNVAHLIFVASFSSFSCWTSGAKRCCSNIQRWQRRARCGSGEPQPQPRHRRRAPQHSRQVTLARNSGMRSALVG